MLDPFSYKITTTLIHTMMITIVIILLLVLLSIKWHHVSELNRNTFGNISVDSDFNNRPLVIVVLNTYTYFYPAWPNIRTVHSHCRPRLDKE